MVHELQLFNHMLSSTYNFHLKKKISEGLRTGSLSGLFVGGLHFLRMIVLVKSSLK